MQFGAGGVADNEQTNLLAAQGFEIHVYDGSLCVTSDRTVRRFIRDWRSGRQLQH
jgi:hypothetical protein